MEYSTFKSENRRKASAPVLYVDMDGCLCKWQTATEEDLRKNGFFESLPPQDNLVEAVRMLSAGWEVRILSAAIEETNAKAEKSRWLASHGLGHIITTFVPNGSVKANYVDMSPGQKFLLDDYSKNLREWTNRGYVGIKFRNGINGTKGTWKGRTVDHTMSAEELFSAISTIIAEENNVE